MQRQALVVDDSRVARLTLSKLLAPYDLDIVQIASGEEALSYLQVNNEKPDIIFMDVTMQGLDGIETTQKIKENEELRSIPVVMCTGHDTQGDLDSAHEVGAIASLAKPPNEAMLADIMAKIEHHETVDEQIEEPEADQNIQVMSEQETDSPIVNENIIKQLEQEWLPKINHVIDERVGDMTRRIATETVKGMMANQLLSSLKKSQQESDELKAEIEADIERELIPKVQQNIQETTEEFSRQLILDSIETNMERHFAHLLPSLKEQLKEQVQHDTVDSAQQTAQKIVDESVETAVQFAIDDYNLPEKALLTLEQQGKGWLTKQEQHISLIASQQVEQNLSPLIAQYLDVNLEEKMAALQAQAEVSIPQEQEDESESLLLIQLDDLTKKVSFLKEVVIVLTLVVVAVVAVVLLQNSGIL